MGVFGKDCALSTDRFDAWSSDPNMARPVFATKYIILNLLGLGLLACILFPSASLKTLQFTMASIIILMASLRLLAIAIMCAQVVRKKFSAGLNVKKLSAKTLKAKASPAAVNWPHFTVLVPLFKEAGVVKSLMNNLAKLEYPKDKLDIIMVCEIDDLATCIAVEKYIRAPFRLFKVGPSEPRTKPKALNAALSTIAANGHDDIVTIYDAEDRPHPTQLKAAALALINDPQLAAVQAPLGYYNAKQNLLTRFFALEYAALFHVWNPALTSLRLPFTLGGTSNHIRRKVLEKAGGWDSHNVTEDADLSFKITALVGKLGNSEKPYKIGCIEYGTQEEAVSNLRSWVHQRSRWLKGFMQTWNVHMRQKQSGPSGKTFHAKARIKNALSLQITVGTTLLAAFLHVPSLCIVSGLVLADSLGIMNYSLSPVFYALLGYGYGAAVFSGMVGALCEGKPRLIPYALLMPFYWLLQFPAALIAAWEFVIAPSYWHKTTHSGEDAKFEKKDKAPALEPALGYPI